MGKFKVELANSHGYLQCYHKELRRIINESSKLAWVWEVHSWIQGSHLLGGISGFN